MADNKPLLQSGWLRALLYIFFSLLMIGSVSFLGEFITPSASHSKVQESLSVEGFVISYLMVAAIMIGLALFFRKIIDRQTIFSLGFGWKGYGGDAAAGFFMGVFILMMGSLILVVAGCLYFTGVVVNLPNLLYSLLLFIMVAFTEEIAFRGYALNNLLQSTNKWIALLVSALLFSLFHAANAHVSFIALLNIFIAGILLGLNYIFTRNLWFAILFHFSWNFFQGPILGYEVSGITVTGLFQQTLKGPEVLTGGDFGFEGSLICLLLTATACAMLAYYYIAPAKTVKSNTNGILK